MLEFDAKEARLHAFKNRLARPSIIPDGKPNVAYESFKNYLSKQLYEDVSQVFMPALQDAIKVSDSGLSIQDGGIVVKQVDPGKYNDRTHHVTVKFSIPGWNDSQAEDVTVLELPHVREDGVIEFNSNEYGFIHMLEQQPAVSYEDNATTQKAQTVKIRNNRRSIWVDDDAKKLRVRFSDRSGASSKTKYTLINLIAAMAKVEGYDIEEIWNGFANFSIVNMFKDEDEKIRHLYYLGGNYGSINASDYYDELVPRLTLTRLKLNGEGDTSYNNLAIRSELNQLLSLNRAIGEVLAKDVESVLNEGKILARAGETVDSTMVDAFESEGVYKLYISHIPNVEGYFLAERVFITYAPQGLKITDDLRQHFPEETGMYTSRFYNQMALPIIYEEGEALTQDMIDVIVAFGYESIQVTDRKTGGYKRTLNFYEEIISNRQVMGKNIGLDSATWYYLDKNECWKPADGTYTTYDFVALQSFCVKLFEGKWIDRVVNTDAGFRKTLVPLEEQYHRAFQFAVREGFKQMNRKFKTIYRDTREDFMCRDRIDNQFYPFHKNFWKYLRDEAKCLVPLSGDNVHNPIAYQSARTKVNVYTANKHSVSDTQREMAMGSYGKIDPFEIPQSQKMGTVYNSTCNADIALDGGIRALYYPVKHFGSQTKLITSKPTYLTAAEEEAFVIADICSLDFDDSGMLYDNNKIVLCRVPAVNSVEKHTVADRPVRDVEYVNADANEPLSWASSTIPFMSSNDSARAIFAVAQEKQAKGLVAAEEPDCITSAYRQFVWLNDKFGIIAKDGGTVVQVSYEWKVDKYFISVHYDSQAVDDGTIYEFNEYFDSGYSITKMKVLVEEGQRFEKGQMLVSSNFISDRGVLMFGVNALTGYICDGYNYEDGTHLSQAMCRRMASYRMNKEAFTGSPRTTRTYRVDKYPEGRWVSPEDGSTINTSYTDQRFLSRERKNQALSKITGFVEGWDPIKEERRQGNYGVELKAISVDFSGRGDKNSNRHGNKGVMSVAEPTENMPRLANGMALDICLNPMGVGSRMNIGQIKECTCGLFCHVLGIQLESDAYNGIEVSEIDTLMSLTVDLMDSVGDISGILTQYQGLVPDGLLTHCAQRIDKIRIYAGCFDKAGTTQVMLPSRNGKMTETRILVGYIYTFKLIQESHKKIHARGGETMGEPYGELTDAPTHGSSKGGGQAFGTMEMNAVCAYGASGYVQELTNQRCDNAIARNNMYVETYLPPSMRKRYLNPGRGQRRSVTQFIYTMLALGLMCEPTNGEFYPLNSNNGAELAHWKPSVLQRANANYFHVYDNNDGKGEGTTTTETEQQNNYQSARDYILGMGSGSLGE